MRQKPKAELVHGTLELLILRTLAREESMHGWGISKVIQQMSENVFQLNQGSLYPALHRLERKGWIRSHWGSSENNRRAKFYKLTRLGRNHLSEERSQWEDFAKAVERVLT